MIDLIVSREDMENILIANFTSTFYEPMVNETVIINASNSFDNFDIYNRNFSYNWTCPPQAKELCPTNSTLNLTAEMRNNISMNKPGLIYRFNVSIYDKTRVSNVA